MSIKQFNATYIQQEDRLLFRLNTIEGTEFRLWLTRLISLNLLSTVRQIIQKDLEKKHNPQVAQVIQEFQEEKIKRTANFQDPYVQASKLPLGAEPILVLGFSLTHKDDQFTVNFKLHGGKTLNLKLPSQAIQSLTSMLEQMETKAQWNINPSPSSLANQKDNLENDANTIQANKLIH